jgi:hypothetical protein
VGHAGKAEKIQGFQIIGQAQRELFELGAVTPENAVNTASDLIKALGFDPDRYVSTPQPPQDKGPPPEVMLEQMKQQGAQALAQLKGQIDAQMEQVRAQTQMQIAQAEQEAQAQQDTLKQQLEHERAQMKLAADMEMERFRADVELRKAEIVARINAEAKILSAKTMGAKDASTADSDADYQEANEGSA